MALPCLPLVTPMNMTITPNESYDSRLALDALYDYRDLEYRYYSQIRSPTRNDD